MAMNSIQYIKVVNNLFEDSMKVKQGESVPKDVIESKQWFASMSNRIACVNCKNALWVEISEGGSSGLNVVCEKIGKIMATLDSERNSSYPKNCYFVDSNETENLKGGNE